MKRLFCVLIVLLLTIAVADAEGAGISVSRTETRDSDGTKVFDIYLKNEETGAAVYLAECRGDSEPNRVSVWRLSDGCLLVRAERSGDAPRMDLLLISESGDALTADRHLSIVERDGVRTVRNEAEDTILYPTAAVEQAVRDEYEVLAEALMRMDVRVTSDGVEPEGAELLFSLQGAALEVLTPDPALEDDGLQKLELTGDVNVRSAPGASNEQVGRLDAGTRVSLLERGTDSEGNTWYRVSHDGAEGWIIGRYAEPVEDSSTERWHSEPETSGEASGSVVSEINVKVRAGAGTEYEQLATLEAGVEATYLGETAPDSEGTAWYRILCGSVDGWVSSRYVTLANAQ